MDPEVQVDLVRPAHQPFQEYQLLQVGQEDPEVLLFLSHPSILQDQEVHEVQVHLPLQGDQFLQAFPQLQLVRVSQADQSFQVDLFLQGDLVGQADLECLAFLEVRQDIPYKVLVLEVVP